MRIENARRLTGRGFFLPVPGVAIEIWLDPGEVLAEVEAAWRAALVPLLALMGDPPEVYRTHTHERGFTTAFSGPIDRLLAMADLLEWGGLSLAGKSELGFAEAAAFYETAVAEQAYPWLVALDREARARAVPLLWDDDAVSLGLGPHAEVFAPRELPEAVDWARYRTIPVGMVTGTNGKTTTTRMVAKILGAAGHVAGMSSTDAIVVGGEIVETGDWTGPGAARRVLRDPRVTAAVLETARGGILRRGLAYERADAAVVTNIGEDHFGDYGISTMAEMARIKSIVWDGVRPGGKRIVNAGDPVSIDHLSSNDIAFLGSPDWVLFGRDEPLIAEHVARGGEAWTAASADGAIVHHAGGATSVIAVADIPAAFEGHARHNVDNALGAAALAFAMGCDHAAIAAGLGGFGTRDNPGRLERYVVDGVNVLLDFAHNPHGVNALAAAIAHVRGPHRLLVVLGQAGDRTQHDLGELTRATLELAPDRVLVRPMRGYERGRVPGEVEALLQLEFFNRGLPADAFALVDDEIAALDAGMAWARPGDLIAVLVHIQRDEVHRWLDLKVSR